MTTAKSFFSAVRIRDNLAIVCDFLPSRFKIPQGFPGASFGFDSLSRSATWIQSAVKGWQHCAAFLQKSRSKSAQEMLAVVAAQRFQLQSVSVLELGPSRPQRGPG